MQPRHSPFVLKFVTHSKRVLEIARLHGWLPGARYTNLRDVRTFDRLGFLDIDWKNYNFTRHLAAAKDTRPLLTVARDIENRVQLRRVIEEAHELSRFCDRVVVVPKAPSLAAHFETLIPPQFVLGFSVPTKYGGTAICPTRFRRPVHLLGGRPDVQRRLADLMPVISFDCNRFTIDAAYGDYFDGEIFRPHPVGGYVLCLENSIKNINKLWSAYVPPNYEQQRPARRSI
jgi:hypothetical protein